MKKLILAISGVFCLQLGFIAYHASDPTAETSFLVVNEQATDRSLAVSVTEPSPYEITVADLGPEVIDEPASPEKPERVIPDREVYSVQTARHQPRKRPALNTFVSQNAVTSLRPVNVTYRLHQGVEFKPQASASRTEYPQAMPEHNVRSYELSAKVASPPKKKGFFSKALPIIKKPYDWLKAVGSTFK